MPNTLQVSGHTLLRARLISLTGRASHRFAASLASKQASELLSCCCAQDSKTGAAKLDSDLDSYFKDKGGKKAKAAAAAAEEEETAAAENGDAAKEDVPEAEAAATPAEAAT